MVIVIVVRRTGPSKVGEKRGVRRQPNLTVLAKRHSRWTLSGTSCDHLMSERRKRDLAFPHDHVIDEGKRSKVLQSHLSIVVGSSEHDGHFGIEILDQLGHREAGHVLIEGGGEADEL